LSVRILVVGDEPDMAELFRHRFRRGVAEFITQPVDFDLLKEQLRQLPSAG
jgi:response regulator of citrate/malate metabolism